MNTPLDNAHNWEFTDLPQLAMANVGTEYGPTPEKCLEDITKSRAAYAKFIADLLGLGPTSIAADLGSGLGFQAVHIAPWIQKLHCLDISQSFLAQCREMLRAQNNVEFHHIPFAHLECLRGTGVDRVYSTAVFIHFNIYDMWLYLSELAKHLPPGGTILFDFANADAIDPALPEWKAHTDMYRNNRLMISCCINHHSLSAVSRLLDLAGFELIKTFDWTRVILVLARKRSS